jgi:hypothetical protein
MNISDEAIEVVARWLWERDSNDIVEGPRPSWDELETSGPVWKSGLSDTRQEAREILEAAAPHLLSHERQLTADAHRDAIVNRDTVGYLQEKLDALSEWATAMIDQSNSPQYGRDVRTIIDTPNEEWRNL